MWCYFHYHSYAHTYADSPYCYAINYGFLTGLYATFTMILLCDYYDITMWFRALQYHINSANLLIMVCHNSDRISRKSRNWLSVTREIRYLSFISSMSDNQALDQNIDIPTDFLRIYSRTFLKVRRNPLQDHFSLKINDPFLITQHGGSGACGGNIPPHARFTNFHTASDHYGNVITHTRDDLKKLLP